MLMPVFLTSTKTRERKTYHPRENRFNLFETRRLKQKEVLDENGAVTSRVNYRPTGTVETQYAITGHGQYHPISLLQQFNENGQETLRITREGDNSESWYYEKDSTTCTRTIWRRDTQYTLGWQFDENGGLMTIPACFVMGYQTEAACWEQESREFLNNTPAWTNNRPMQLKPALV